MGTGCNGEVRRINCGSGGGGRGGCGVGGYGGIGAGGGGSAGSGRVGCGVAVVATRAVGAVVVP